MASSSSDEQYVGMSDAEEIARSTGNSVGVGETTYVDLSDDMRTLGLS